MAAISQRGIHSDHIPFPALKRIVRKITVVTGDGIPSPGAGAMGGNQARNRFGVFYVWRGLVRGDDHCLAGRRAGGGSVKRDPVTMPSCCLATNRIRIFLRVAVQYDYSPPCSLARY